MTAAIKLPEIGESVSEAQIGEIYIHEGDEIDVDQTILKLESDKASMDLPSTQKGKVKKINVSKGDLVHVGDTLIELESGTDNEDRSKEREEGDLKEEKKRHEAEAEKQPEKGSDEQENAKIDLEESDVEREQESKDFGEPREDSEENKDEEKEMSADSHKKRTTPIALRIANNFDINIDDLEGTGSEGRVTIDDVIEALVEKVSKKTDFSKRKIEPEKNEDFAAFGEIKRKKLDSVTLSTAKNTSRSWQEIPHVTHCDFANITALEKVRKQLNQSGNGQPVHLTITAFVVRVLASVLPKFPEFNASLMVNTKELIVKKYVNIGVAVDTDYGLVVPVIREANHKNLMELAIEIEKKAASARDKMLTPGDFAGGTFSMTNLGGIGGTSFTPIIRYPEVAILGLARAENKNGDLMLPLLLSYDHRIINGADAARFVNRIKQDLSDPAHMIADL